MKNAKANDDTVLLEGQSAPFAGVLVDPPTYKQNTIYKLEAQDFKNNLNSYIKCVPIDDSAVKLISPTGVAAIAVAILIGIGIGLTH